MSSEKKSARRTALIIMDGWGINPDPAVNAISQADTPFVDALYKKHPNATLKTHAEHVGLPAGQMGNSEVGHMNLGAGRVVYQELLKINRAIDSGEFFSERTLTEAVGYAADGDRSLHLIGLVSDGGVHSHIDHLKALIDLADRHGVEKTYVHAFTDGRDTDPRSGIDLIRDLEAHCRNSKASIASVIGRYYAMDRDHRWPRIKLAWDLLVQGKGTLAVDPVSAIQASYDAGVTDEFIRPVSVRQQSGRPAVIREGDAVICFNFRTDRCRQLTRALTQEDMEQEGMHTLPLHYVTMTRYDAQYRNVRVVYDNKLLSDTLGEVIAAEGLRQLRIAETEKYPHVTFFFSGGREEEFPGESRIMINSPAVATYDLQPEMSAYEVKDAVIRNIRGDCPDFICLNYANTDMVGHTGDFRAAMKAAETVDQCVRETVEAMLEANFLVFLTADHGNADTMINPDGTPNTAHTRNLVPLFVIGNDFTGKVEHGRLADIAPTILSVMGLDIPSVMTGNILVNNNPGA